MAGRKWLSDSRSRNRCRLVVQDHAGCAALKDLKALVDAAVAAACADDDLAGERPWRSCRTACPLVIRCSAAQDDRSRAGDACRDGDAIDIERGAAVSGQVQSGLEGAIERRSANRGLPWGAVLGSCSTGAAVAGRRVDRNSGCIGIKERELDRIAVRICPATDREVDDVDVIHDRLLNCGHRVGLVARVLDADAVHDHFGTWSDAARGTAINAEAGQRGPPRRLRQSLPCACRGLRRRVPSTPCRRCCRSSRQAVHR